MTNTVAAPLAHRLRLEASAPQIADAIVETWHEIDTALTPIIGKRGLAALYRRSVFITAQTHRWLAITHDDALAFADFAELKPPFLQ